MEFTKPLKQSFLMSNSILLLSIIIFVLLSFFIGSDIMSYLDLLISKIHVKEFSNINEAQTIISRFNTMLVFSISSLSIMSIYFTSMIFIFPVLYFLNLHGLNGSLESISSEKYATKNPVAPVLQYLYFFCTFIFFIELIILYVACFIVIDLIAFPSISMFIVFIGLMLYFLPLIIAKERKHHNIIPITLTNLLLGFTIIGWIIALIWSTTSTRKEIHDIN